MNNIFLRTNSIFEWIMKFAVTNILWILFNFPIAYLTLSLFFAENMSQTVMILITIAFLVPFIFFPATTAMFGVVRKWVMGDDERLVRFYWKYYKENFKQSVTGGLVIVLLWAILGVDYYYFQDRIPLVSYLFLFLLVLLFLFTLYFFANMVHTETTLLQGLKNAFTLSIVNPIFSFSFAIINIGILYICIMHLPFLLPFFSGSLIAYITFFAYYKVFNHVIELQKERSKEEAV